MAESTFQGEVPKTRVNIRLGLHTVCAQKKGELPLKLLAVGNFSNGKETLPLSESSEIHVNKKNFNSVLSALNSELKYSAQNTLSDEGVEESISLGFQKMKGVESEKVARQIPPAMRNSLRERKSTPLDNITFRKNREKILLIRL